MTHKQERVLIVDDLPEVLDLLVRTIRQSNSFCSVEAARTGKEALTRMSMSPPNILLLDYHLPDKNGLEICESVKHVPFLSSMKIFVMSGPLPMELQTRLQQAGVKGFLTKPIRPALLTQMLGLPKSKKPVTA